MNNNYKEEIPWNLIAKEITGSIDVAESEILQKWLAISAEHRKIFDDSKLIFEKANSEKELKPNTDEAWIKLSQRISFKKRKTPVLKLWHYAAAVALAIMLLGSYWAYPQMLTYFSAEDRSKWLSVQNSSQEPKTIQMPDGSTIVLNKNSEIRYPDKFDKRSVEIKGEAYFKVVSNPKKPFKVYASDTEIEVIGTSFNVNQSSKSGDVFVMVESGKVNFSAKGAEPVLLLAGKGGLYKSAESKIIPKINLNASAWNSKSFRFQNTPVSEILTSLSEVYGLNVKVSSETLLQCEFNGVFDNLDPENILHAISFSLGAKLSFENGFYTLSGQGCNN